MAKRKFNQKATNPFDDGPLTPEKADEALYGSVEIGGASSRVVAYPIDIHKLRADVTQPRRTVPLSVRGDWDGTADGVKQLLEKWGEAVHKERGKSIFPHLVVRGAMEEPIEVDEKTQPLSAKFLSLLQLAGSIRREGLLNPIQVYRQGDGGQIVAGERRWLAHHVLSLYDDDVEQWTMIPAVDTAKVDVWAQATENGRRAPLNAISMARQLALLIMDMYINEVEFEPFEEVVTSGSDRAFYAQVADGVTYRIKRGMSDQILEVTGLTNRQAIGRYRDLLGLDDDTWVLADEEDWTEGACRRVLRPEQFEEKEPEVPQNADMSSIGDISKVDPQDLQTGTGYAQQYQPSNPPAASNKMGAIPDGGGQIKVGQIRARYETEDFPYLKVLREFDRGDWQVDIHDVDGHNVRLISTKAIYTYWSVVLKSEPSPPQTNPIVQGQPTPPVDNNPYDEPMSDILDLDTWEQSSGEQRTDEAIKQQGTVDLMGYGDPEYPAGDAIDFEEGRRPTHYPQSTPQTDDEWEDTPARPRTDGSEHIPMATTHTDLLDVWLKHLQMICMAYSQVGEDYQKQSETLREMKIITPAKIKDIREQRGDGAVIDLLNSYIDAVADMHEKLKYEVDLLVAGAVKSAGITLSDGGDADEE